ncbi:RICIN domain-containing protein [Streptomyces stramineus]
MTFTPAPRRPVPFLRMVAAALAACCAALGIALSPPLAAPAHAAENCDSALQCMTFTSQGNGRALDVQNGSRNDGAYIVTNSAPGHHQSWRLNVDATDSSFSIVNNTTGKCIDVGWPTLRQQTCRGQKSQKWYFQPVSGSTDAFMIRNANDNSCIDLTANAQYNDAWTGKSSCHGAANQRWTTASAAAWNLAVDHGARVCQKNTASCHWTVKSEAPAAPLPKVCASAVWYNNTGSEVPQTFSVTKESGWESSIGTTLQSDISGGNEMALQATISSALTFNNTWRGSSSVNDAITVRVPDKNYGWVTLAKLARKVTGNWTFDAQGLPWTADDTITVPVQSDPAGGATLYSANVSPTFTSCV